jgi:hypothetical protein
VIAFFNYLCIYYVDDSRFLHVVGGVYDYLYRLLKYILLEKGSNSWNAKLNISCVNKFVRLIVVV